MVKSHSRLSDESDQVASTTATHLLIMIILLLSKWFTASLLKTMWDNKDGCANQYDCACNIYLLYCLALECCIIIDRSFGANCHGKDVDNVLNDIDKHMFKL